MKTKKEDWLIPDSWYPYLALLIFVALILQLLINPR